MLVALLLGFFLTGGGGRLSPGVLTPNVVKDIEARVEASVSAPARVDAAKAILEQLGSEVERFDEAFESSGDELSRLYRDPSSRTSEMVASLDEMEGTWAAAQARGLDLRFELRDLLTESEWAAVFGAP